MTKEEVTRLLFLNQASIRRVATYYATRWPGLQGQDLWTADDLYQELILRVLEKHADFQAGYDEKAMFGYAAKILYHIAVNLSRIRDKSGLYDTIEHAEQNVYLPAEEYIDRDLRRNNLYAAIRKLTPTQQRVIHASFRQEKEEVLAQELGITHTAYRNAKHIGIKQLRILLT